MLNTIKLEIDSLSNKIDVILNVDVSEATCTQLNFYTNKDLSGKSFDLSYLLKGELVEEFIIKPEYVDLEYFVGLFFIEIFLQREDNDSPCDNEELHYIFPIGNFTKYHYCILNDITNIYIENCEIKLLSNKNLDDECTTCQNKIFFKNTLLDSLYTAILYELYEDACLIAENLDKLCEECNCTDFPEPTTNLSGIMMSTEEIENNIVVNRIIKY